jgi:ribosome-associated translation inhibitor RaiA
MKVNVQTHQVSLPPGANEAISQRVGKVFRRLHTHVAHIDITLRWDCGDSGRKSGVCQLKVDLLHGGQVLVIERRRRLRSALHAAMKRGKHGVVRALRRRRSQRRRSLPAAPRMMEPIAVMRHRHT